MSHGNYMSEWVKTKWMERLLSVCLFDMCDMIPAAERNSDNIYIFFLVTFALLFSQGFQLQFVPQVLGKGQCSVSVLKRWEPDGMSSSSLYSKSKVPLTDNPLNPASLIKQLSPGCLYDVYRKKGGLETLGFIALTLALLCVCVYACVCDGRHTENLL